MFLFLVPLLTGFFFNAASAFTNYYSKFLGERWGRITCVDLRVVLGVGYGQSGILWQCKPHLHICINQTYLQPFWHGF
jgi:hypothetical protein